MQARLGHISRSRDADDERQVRVRLTDKGWRSAKQAPWASRTDELGRLRNENARWSSQIEAG